MADDQMSAGALRYVLHSQAVPQRPAAVQRLTKPCRCLCDMSNWPGGGIRRGVMRQTASCPRVSCVHGTASQRTGLVRSLRARSLRDDLTARDANVCASLPCAGWSTDGSGGGGLPIVAIVAGVAVIGVLFFLLMS